MSDDVKALAEAWPEVARPCFSCEETSGLALRSDGAWIETGEDRLPRLLTMVVCTNCGLDVTYIGWLPATLDHYDGRKGWNREFQEYDECGWPDALLGRPVAADGTPEVLKKIARDVADGLVPFSVLKDWVRDNT